MASSNRHWPSMFRSKPCNSDHHQWQHDINPCSHHKPPYTSGFEERSPEPKPRWNPKPEQIKILEAIFNSGMVNPPREEIRKIRGQLQEYGHVGDANVFYWFQNRKSRSKNKQRQLVSARSLSQPTPPPPPSTAAAKTATASSSSSSSEQSAGSDKASHPTTVQLPALLPPVLLQAPLDSSGEQFPHQFSSQGYCLSVADVAGILGAVAPEHVVSLCPSLWGEITGREPENSITKSATQLHHFSGTGAAGAAAAAGGGAGGGAPTNSVTVSRANATCGSLGEQEGMGVVGGMTSSIVFINEVAFEVAAKPLNVREAFGREAILLDHSGQTVLTDEWGITIHPLQYGASYYLV